MAVSGNGDRTLLRRLLKAVIAALSNSPSITVRRLFERARRRFDSSRRRAADRMHSSFGFRCVGELRKHVGQLATTPDHSRLEEMRIAARHWCEHRFDLLGSGWVQVAHGVATSGVEGNRYQATGLHAPDIDGEWLLDCTNPANTARSREVWRLIEQPYRAIDWQLDFKSGYRWSERQWSRDITFGTLPGVDIKVPWELARMQHLPAMAALLALENDASTKEFVATTYKREFRNQVLDFIATNPPRWGVNWYYSMEVGIRVANWLVAYDLFRAHGIEFDPAFDAIFLGSVWDHARHISGNLEWDPLERGNHYLSNVVGLLFAAAYLPVTSETIGWISWSTTELTTEITHQFYSDGGNIEASTCYHRLSAELALYGAALLLGIDTSSTGAVPRLVGERLERAVEFLMSITTPAGSVVQIGDNDNGRLFRLFPSYIQMRVSEARDAYSNLAAYDSLPDDEIFLVEQHLDHRQVAAVAGRLFAREDFQFFAGDGWIDADLASLLAQGRHLPSLSREERSASSRIAVASHADLSSHHDRLPDVPDDIYNFPLLERKTRNDMSHSAFPEFGLYVYRSQHVFAMVRCGGTHLSSIAGHAHNDQLSVELWIDGRPILRDPGTYLYTPLPVRRNQYRSVKAHSSPQLNNEEQGRLDSGLFSLPSRSAARCMAFEEHRFVGYYSGYSAPVWREVIFGEECVQIRDYGTATGTRSEVGVRNSTNLVSLEAPAFSPGYGWQCV